MSTPKIKIDLDKIAHNTRTLKELYNSRGISITGVTKVMSGDPHLAKILVDNGLNVLADSRMTNIRKMWYDGASAEFMLLRTLLSEVDDVVKFTDISLNSDLSIIRALSNAAQKLNSTHQIILMIELGDLREGVMPTELNSIVRNILKLPGIKLVGIGTNLACFAGVKPDERKMKQLSFIANDLESRFSIALPIVSGGNSANYNWFKSSIDLGRINHLRLGESIFLGCEPINKVPITDLFTDAFTIYAEVIESGLKPSAPYGEQGLDAFGKRPEFKDSGQIQRAILAIGKQDVMIEGLTPPIGMDILGANSDHLILNTQKTVLNVGDKVAFGLNYGALLSAMHSNTVEKNYVQATKDRQLLPNGGGKRLASQATLSYN